MAAAPGLESAAGQQHEIHRRNANPSSMFCERSARSQGKPGNPVQSQNSPKKTVQLLPGEHYGRLDLDGYSDISFCAKILETFAKVVY